MRSTLLVLLLTVTAAWIFVPKTYAASPCPGDPDCPTPTPTPRVCDDLKWYCLRECASSATREVFGGNAQLWRQQKIEFTNRDNGTNYTSCQQAGPITPQPSQVVAPTTSAPSASPRPTVTPTPPLNGSVTCSPSAWQLAITWNKPADNPASGYTVNLNHYILSSGSDWFNYDGTDFSKQFDNTVSQTTVDILPRQKYLVEVLPSILATTVTCKPAMRTTVTALCFTGDTKNSSCTVDVWAKDMAESNSGTIANDILAPSTDTDLNTSLDLLDFERIRAATHD